MLHDMKCLPVWWWTKRKMRRESGIYYKNVWKYISCVSSLFLLAHSSYFLCLIIIMRSECSCNAIGLCGDGWQSQELRCHRVVKLQNYWMKLFIIYSILYIILKKWYISISLVHIHKYINRSINNIEVFPL